MAAALPPNVHLSNTPAAHVGPRVVRGAVSRGHPSVVIWDPGEPPRVVVIANDLTATVMVAADRQRRIAAVWSSSDDSFEDQGGNEFACCDRVRSSAWTDGAMPQPPQTLSAPGIDGAPDGIALSPSGQVRVVWEELDRVGDYVVGWTEDAAAELPAVQREESSYGDIPSTFANLGGGRVAFTWQTPSNTVALNLPHGRPRTLPVNTDGGATVFTTRAGDRLIAWQDGRYKLPDLHVARLPWRGRLGRVHTVARKVDYYSWSFAFEPGSLLFSWTRHLPHRTGAVFVRRGHAATTLKSAQRLARAGHGVDRTRAALTPVPTVRWINENRGIGGTARLTGKPAHWRIIGTP